MVLPPGPSELDLWVEVEEPRLWWPWDLGKQHLYSLDLSVVGARSLVGGNAAIWSAENPAL